LVFSPVEAQSWMMSLPAFGQTLLFGQLLRGEAVDLVNVILSGVMTLLATALLLWFASRLYERETLVFGR